MFLTMFTCLNRNELVHKLKKKKYSPFCALSLIFYLVYCLFCDILPFFSCSITVLSEKITFPEKIELLLVNIHPPLYAKTCAKKKMFLETEKWTIILPFAGRGNCQMGRFFKWEYIQDTYWKIPYLVPEFLRIYQHVSFSYLEKSCSILFNLYMHKGKGILVYHPYLGFYFLSYWRLCK